MTIDQQSAGRARAPFPASMLRADTIAGLAYDGMYRLLLTRRSDDPGGPGSDAFIISYATFDDLINSPPGAPGIFPASMLRPTTPSPVLPMTACIAPADRTLDRPAGRDGCAHRQLCDIDLISNSPPGAPGVFGINVAPDHYRRSPMTECTGSC
ncbi:MAG: hypothetical protein R3C58_07235 [Parvularculaceae bacterium]